MAEILLPPWVGVADVSFRAVNPSAESRGMYTGEAQVAALGGDRLSASLSFAPTTKLDSTSAQKRAALIAFLSRLRGRQNRAWLCDPGYTPRGSFPASELLSNNTFASGTAGWTATNGVLTVADRIGRLTATTPAANVQFEQIVTLSQYVPYVLRSHLLEGAQTAGLSIGPFLGCGNNSANDYSTSRGMRTVAAVNDSASAQGQYPVVFSAVSGFTAGAYVENTYSSLSQCALVDNGQNLLLRSDEIDNAAWGSINLTVTANNAVAPNGTTTGEDLVEDSSNSEHTRYQQYTVASSAADYCVCFALKAGTRSFGWLELYEATGGSSARQFFNLSTGAVGASGVTGANWAHRRSFVVDMGSGWYMCCMVARKTNAATTLRAYVGLGTADGTSNYAGNGSGYIRAWRGTVAQSSVPVRLTQTTSSATAGSSQTGPALFVKGLPASTSGLLLYGDWVQIGNQLCMVAAPLNSDAAGLGHLQLAWPLRTPPSDNTPVIIHQPMGRFMFTGQLPEWLNAPGITTASAEFEEA